MENAGFSKAEAQANSGLIERHASLGQGPNMAMLSFSQYSVCRGSWEAASSALSLSLRPQVQGMHATHDCLLFRLLGCVRRCKVHQSEGKARILQIAAISTGLLI